MFCADILWMMLMHDTYHIEHAASLLPKYADLIAAQDALCEARAMEIVLRSQALPVEEGMKALDVFVAGAESGYTD